MVSRSHARPSACRSRTRGPERLGSCIDACTILREARRHSAYRVLKTIPGLGLVRVAQILAAIACPERFRTKRQLWTYCGVAVGTPSSAEDEFVRGKAQPREKKSETRGMKWE